MTHNDIPVVSCFSSLSDFFDMFESAVSIQPGSLDVVGKWESCSVCDGGQSVRAVVKIGSCPVHLCPDPIVCSMCAHVGPDASRLHVAGPVHSTGSSK